MSKARLLIIDDQPEVRAEVKERIESLGHEADEAACQEEALRKLDGMHFDCVLLDLKIPVKLEGVPRIDHGKNLLQRIVAMTGAPPVIVITSYGLDGHKLAVEMMEIGAKSFVAKPFDGDPLEPKIRQILEHGGRKPSTKPQFFKPFEGGALVVNEDGIELCEILVGGVRSNAIIRGVVQCLSIKPNGKYVKASAKQLAEKIAGSPNPPSLTAAIKEFREQCTSKLRAAGIECGGDAVIQTISGGGYQLREWIQVHFGREDKLSSETEKDCAHVMRVFSRTKKLTAKQVRELITLPPVRTTTAMATLVERGNIKNIGGSGSTTTYEFITA